MDNKASYSGEYTVPTAPPPIYIHPPPKAGARQSYGDSSLPFNFQQAAGFKDPEEQATGNIRSRLLQGTRRTPIDVRWCCILVIIIIMIISLVVAGAAFHFGRGEWNFTGSDYQGRRHCSWENH
ncbi:uncharacterized protein BP5553_09863 [Venustampulla echinocandica]|uniref:Uncharacterized protein n=1 Tax=Venustampulla echinocandica TaxID=2656787 RepID=A0A370TAW7_9HELO|nr:uncharacterized protein BP5553_09863 [Venustampulla echinocandica]RDL31074.1 hypothetical protein BP5553_09863 [Venustampulla echinocandica]